MNAWDRFWYGPISAIRPYLLSKLFLLVLAVDACLVTLTRSPSYYTDTLNVAHFGWLNAIKPDTPPEFYSALMIAISILAFTLVFVRGARWMYVLLALMYTYGWSHNMKDMYQHHYFISLALVALIFFPRFHTNDLFPLTKNSDTEGTGKTRFLQINKLQVRAWAYALLGVNIGILYFYTAVNKFEADWRTGLVLKTRGILDSKSPIRTWIVERGDFQDTLWALMAFSVIILELIIAVGYFMASSRDRKSGWKYTIIFWVMFTIALMLHGGFEVIGNLSIGLFSFYMLALASACFLPASFLWTIGSILTWPFRSIHGYLEYLSKKSSSVTAKSSFIWSIVATVVIVAAIPVMGYEINLPGSTTVAVAVSIILIISLAASIILKRLKSHIRYTVATALAVLIVGSAIMFSDIQYSLNKDIGVALIRKSRYQNAEDFLEKAKLYANEQQLEFIEELYELMDRRTREKADKEAYEIYR